MSLVIKILLAIISFPAVFVIENIYMILAEIGGCETMFSFLGFEISEWEFINLLGFLFVSGLISKNIIKKYYKNIYIYILGFLLVNMFFNVTCDILVHQ